ncbi:electron transfer flavoprotein subunit alpha/FixB family protein [Ostreibacterium oceani]|uniref:Electron transfer flavoprotein subunit alpha n=1 Tax=Ostreibacterium oceani TaxID=2654998 RepID=A0A6N7EW42_9GAMM|nr:electron transfer flavoprotein subunit alpha/FixB family protein [Ostreibacterium oceani]MPV85307.1 electron transfer flavoprotein subunit alpha/FixB family protein [Ostreibacterium oceani]
MAVLVLIEHDNQEINAASLNTITAASQIGGELHALVLGDGVSSVAEKAAAIAGVDKVLTGENAAFAHALAENIAPAVVAIAGDYTHILGNATTQGKNIMPRIAALLDVMQLSEISAVKSDEVFERLIYAGNAIVEVRSNDPKKVITVRATKFDSAPASGGSAEIVSITAGIAAGSDSGLSQFVEAKLADNAGPELATASIVVSGGRGMGSKENYFGQLTPLAEKLNAALGASRAAVDSGFCPNDHQVGQTGKVIAPDLYIAIGISGAIQHQAGMKDSKVIVAINNDPDAPIFQIADYGLVADLNEAIPALVFALS